MSKDPNTDGQKDFTEGKYDPLHYITPVDYAIHSEHTLEKMQEEDDHYDSGYNNAQEPEVGSWRAEPSYSTT
jgi:hypothetical protein